MGSRPDDEISDNGVTGTAVAVAAAAGVAALAVWGISKLFAGVATLAVWGISKLFGSSEPEPKRHEKIMLSSSSSSSSSSGSVRDQNRNEVSQLILEGKWTRPKQGWLKLNTDASAHTQGAKTGPAAAGGVIRNDAGEWIVGFTSKLEDCDSTQAELEAVREGLLLALKWGCTKVEVETDSEQAVNWIENPDLKNRPSLWLVADDCRKLLSRLGSEIGHVSREGNRCADALASIRIPEDERLIVWKNIPNNENVRRAVTTDMKH